MFKFFGCIFKFLGLTNHCKAFTSKGNNNTKKPQLPQKSSFGVTGGRPGGYAGGRADGPHVGAHMVPYGPLCFFEKGYVSGPDGSV